MIVREKPVFHGRFTVSPSTEATPAPLFFGFCNCTKVRRNCRNTPFLYKESTAPVPGNDEYPLPFIFDGAPCQAVLTMA